MVHKQADLCPIINDSQAEGVKILMDFKRRKIDNAQIAIPDGSSMPRSCCIADARSLDPPNLPCNQISWAPVYQAAYGLLPGQAMGLNLPEAYNIVYERARLAFDPR